MSTRFALALSGLSGLLMALAFPPFGLWPLGWVGLAPIFWVLARASIRQTILAGLIFGAVHAGIGMYWLAVIDWVNLTALAVYFSLFYGGALVLLRFVIRRDTRFRPLAAAAGWVGLDLLIGRLFSGIPWMSAGYAQAPLTTLTQVADIAGVHGVTFLGALSAGLLAYGPGAVAGSRAAALRRVAPVGAVWVAMVVAAWFYGADRLERFGGAGRSPVGPDLLLVQPGIPQALKDAGGLSAPEDVFLRNDALTRRALVAEPRPDLVIWSETMNPTVILPLGDGAFPSFDRSRAFYTAHVRENYRTAFLLGTVYATRPPTHRSEIVPYYNSALFFSSRGEPGARYDKLHPIPWAEYIPLGLDFVGEIVESFAGFPMRMRAGKEAVVFPFGAAGEWSFGASICFDIIYPRYARQLARGGARFLVNLTNEAWFGTSAEFDQLLNMARFRAIENRMGVVRATNSGISAAIDRAGSVLAKVTDGAGRDRGVKGVLRCRPPLRDGLTIYSRVGDLFGVSCALLAMITALLGLRRKTS